MKYEHGARFSVQVIYPNTSAEDKGEAFAGARENVLHRCRQVAARFGLLEYDDA